MSQKSNAVEDLVVAWDQMPDYVIEAAMGTYAEGTTTKYLDEFVFP
jgi:hypothetical protein